VYLAFGPKDSELLEGREVAESARDSVAAWDAANKSAPFRFGEHVVLSAWRRLWTIGDRASLAHPLLGLFCSSRCPGDIILRTYDLARALRDAGVPVIGGFHSPMEREWLDLLLRGRQPVVVCPARSIENMRLPGDWKKPIDDGRLLVLSPFPAQHSRPTATLAEQRNEFVTEIAGTAFVAHAGPGSKTAGLCQVLTSQRKPVWTLDGSSQSVLRSLGARCFPSIDEILEAFDASGPAGA
jgi:hypothetical protein